MRTFGKIEGPYSGLEDSEVLLQSIPYDGTSTWGKGADKAFDAFMEASDHLELYDIETDSEVYKKGIHILPEIDLESTPEEVFSRIYNRTKDLLKYNKMLTFIGGEHSISIGIIQAYQEKFPNLTVLQLDAHTDLRAEYNDSEYNHACALHRASKNTNLIQVGIRSMDSSELDYFDRSKCVFARQIHEDPEWIRKVVSMIKGDVYITLDMDVFDPSLIPGTGTPEPGGLNWYQVTGLMKQVFRKARVRGFDMVEFAPAGSLRGPAFLMVKLYYKMLSYKYYG